VLAAFVPMLIATKSAGELDLQPESRLWIAGSSTVRSFQCQATSFEAKVVSNPGATAAILAGEKAVSAVDVNVPAEKLDCRNGTMNEHMRKALKAQEFPTIAFRVASYDLTRVAEGMNLTLAGTLTLGGVEKPITVAALVKGTDDGRLLVTGTHEVRMTEFDLKPPKLMLGTMRVDEKIKVGFEIALKD
jgi:polyisoprenoid-binding protein YceI